MALSFSTAEHDSAFPKALLTDPDSISGRILKIQKIPVTTKTPKSSTLDPSTLMEPKSAKGKLSQTYSPSNTSDPTETLDPTKTVMPKYTKRKSGKTHFPSTTLDPSTSTTPTSREGKSGKTYVPSGTLYLLNSVLLESVKKKSSKTYTSSDTHDPTASSSPSTFITPKSGKEKSGKTYVPRTNKEYNARVTQCLDSSSFSATVVQFENKGVRMDVSISCSMLGSYSVKIKTFLCGIKIHFDDHTKDVFGFCPKSCGRCDDF